jgi:hypothetical protein
MFANQHGCTKSPGHDPPYAVGAMFVHAHTTYKLSCHRDSCPTSAGFCAPICTQWEINAPCLPPITTATFGPTPPCRLGDRDPLPIYFPQNRDFCAR